MDLEGILGEDISAETSAMDITLGKKLDALNILTTPKHLRTISLNPVTKA